MNIRYSINFRANPCSCETPCIQSFHVEYQIFIFQNCQSHSFLLCDFNISSFLFRFFKQPLYSKEDDVELDEDGGEDNNGEDTWISFKEHTFIQYIPIKMLRFYWIWSLFVYYFHALLYGAASLVFSSNGFSKGSRWRPQNFSSLAQCQLTCISVSVLSAR